MTKQERKFVKWQYLADQQRAATQAMSDLLQELGCPAKWLSRAANAAYSRNIDVTEVRATNDDCVVVGRAAMFVCVIRVSGSNRVQWSHLLIIQADDARFDIIGSVIERMRIEI